MNEGAGLRPLMRIDYDKIAEDYDAHRRGGGPYTETLLGLVRRVAPERVLELGAGTGNNTSLLLDHVRCVVVAADRSFGMLGKAREKGLAAQWVQSDARALPFGANAFDFVFATYLLHHIRDLAGLFGECLRVLRSGGCAAFVTVSEHFIAAHPMNAYFPSFAAVDRARFQPISAVLEALSAAGFKEIGAQSDVDPPRRIDTAYAERIAARFISTYDLLPRAEFERGLARLRADLAAGGGVLPLEIAREATTVWGVNA